jgi:hypothetical protein
MDIITELDETQTLHNDITREMDKHLIYVPRYTNTYIYDTLMGNKALIRYPGATRGYIEFSEDNIIIDIIIQDPPKVACYKPSVNEAVKKFIGDKLIFTTEMIHWENN